MKKFLVLATALLLTACASYDVQQAMRPDNRNIDPKLPNMEAIFETGKALETNGATAASGASAATSVQLNNEFATLFRREVEKNLINEDGPVKGKLVLEPIFVDVDNNVAWALTAFLLGIPQLFGVPGSSMTSKWELELNVLDKNGKRIARYSADVENTEYEALYYGYSNLHPITSNLRKAAIFEGYKKALDNVIKQLQADIPTLSTKLK